MTTVLIAKSFVNRRGGGGRLVGGGVNMMIRNKVVAVAKSKLTATPSMVPSSYNMRSISSSSIRLSTSTSSSSSSSSSPHPDIQIVEVSPRDGLQNETLAASGILTTDDKVELIQRLANSGVTNIEMGSFVSPKWVPAMSDSEQVITGYYNNDDVEDNKTISSSAKTIQSSVLVPNIKGLQRSLSLIDDKTGKPLINEIAVGASASDLFAYKNWNCQTSKDLIETKCIPVANSLHDYNKEHSTNIKLRVYISCVVGCPYQGYVEPKNVASIIEQLMVQLPSGLEVSHISLGDTIGVGTPNTIRNMLNEVYEVLRGYERVHDHSNSSLLAAHYHDTYGQALSNILTSIEHPCEIRCIDSSVAGLGGCPYANGSSGNVATEDVIYML